MKPMEEIYQEYAKTVYRFLLSRTRNADLSEELTQETFFQAIRTVNRYDETCKVSTWLLGIAKNVLLSYRRKNPATEDIADQEIPVESAEDTVLKSAGRVELLRKLHELKEPQREVVYLRVFGGLSFREIGDIFAKTENWARVTFYRAKEQLRKELSDEQDSM